MRRVPVVIAPRFNGPPRSGHGGYSAGCAAALVDAPVAEVTLRRPPPLGRGARRDARATAPRRCSTATSSWRPRGRRRSTSDGPPPVGLDAAAAAAGRFAWEHDHPFPTCFGCGPERDPADALCLFTGPVGDGRFAVPWTPPAWTRRRRRRPGVRVGGAGLPELRAGPRHDQRAGRARPADGRAGGADRGRRAARDPVVAGGQRRAASATPPSRSSPRSGERRAAGRAVWVELARPLGA